MLSSIGMIKHLVFKVVAGLLAAGAVVTAAVMLPTLWKETPQEPLLPEAGEAPRVWTLKIEETLTLVEETTYPLRLEYAYTDATGTVSVEASEAPDLGIRWTSSDEAVATVDDQGVVIARAPGVAEINVAVQDGSASAVCTVTVTEKPVKKAESVQVPAKLTLNVGGEASKKIVATLTPADAQQVTITYQTSNAAVATVDETGTVRAVGNGTCVIKTTAINKDGSAVFAETQVTVHTPVKKLSVQDKLSLLVGKSGKLSLEMTPSKADTGLKITWSSSNSKVATVDKNGKVKAIAAGTATITATNEFGVAAKCVVTVTKPAEKPAEKPEEKPVEKPAATVCGYCKAEGHKESVCVKKSVDKGAVGRWSISDVKVNVAVYMGTSSSQKNTAIVNATDSGIYLKKGDGYLIGDHNYQGFEAIKKCKPGTVAYLDTGKQVVKYVCTKVFKGYNEKYYLTDANGVKYNLPKDYIANYTCNENSHSVTIVEFKPVEMTGQSAGSIVQGEIFEGMLDFFGGWYTR